MSDHLSQLVSDLTTEEITWSHKPEMIKQQWEDPNSPLWIEPWIWFVYNPPEGTKRIRNFNAVLR